MKSPIAAVVLMLGTHFASADHDAQAYYEPGPAVVYDQPVIYQAPVVYTAPVVYNAPVTYQVNTVVAPVPVMEPVYPVALPVNPVYNTGDPVYRNVVYTPPPCPGPNVIIAGHGAYRSSWHCSPTVITIGRGHASHGSLPRRYR